MLRFVGALLIRDRGTRPGSATHLFMLHRARGDSMHIRQGGPGRKRKKAAGEQRLFSFRVFLVLEARQA